MKNVNLFGMTTAEKLIKLEKAYDEVMASVIYNGHYEGEWNATTEYGFGAYVNYKGSSYIYINEVASINTNPENGVPWVLIAEKGDMGGLQSLNAYNPFMGVPSDKYVTVEENTFKLKIPTTYNGKNYKYFRLYMTPTIHISSTSYTTAFTIPETYLKEGDTILNNSIMITFTDNNGAVKIGRLLYNIARDATSYIYSLELFFPYNTPIPPNQINLKSLTGTIGFSED